MTRHIRAPRPRPRGPIRARLLARAAAAAVVLAAAAGPALADTPSSGGGPGAGSDASSGAASGVDPDPGPGAWQPRGRPLAGAGTTADAPQMQPGVTYRDSIRPDETRFYGVALDARVSAAVSVFALPPTRSAVAYGDGVELKLLSPDGEECDSTQAHFRADGDARPIGTAVSRLITGERSGPCQGADQYTLQVHRTSAGTSDPGAWPLELRYVAEPGLKPGAAPPTAPAVPPAGTPSPTPHTAGTPRTVTGGPSIDDAAAVGTGIWKDRVPPGETRFYRIPVDWGQQATVFADFSSAPVKDENQYVGSGARLDVYSPVREYVAGGDRAYQGSPVELSEQLPVVAYGNRASLDEEIAPVRYAGWYYIAVTVHPDVAKAVSGPVPVTLRIDVTGTAAAAPPYDGDADAAGIGVTAHDLAAANGTAGGGSSSSGPLRFVGFAALGAGTVLLLWLGGWYGVAWRRAAGAAQAARSPRRAGG